MYPNKPALDETRFDEAHLPIARSISAGCLPAGVGVNGSSWSKDMIGFFLWRLGPRQQLEIVLTMHDTTVEIASNYDQKILPIDAVDGIVAEVLRQFQLAIEDQTANSTFE